MTEKTISVQSLAKLKNQGSLDLVDVRTPLEFRAVHAKTAKNFPLDSLDPQTVMFTRNGQTDEPLYLICKGGARAAKACKKFCDAGFTNVANVEGGTEAWIAAGLPVVRGKAGMSLERQVRIAAGFLVFVSSLLAILVHPFWAGVAAFIGAGLVFAGITDWCGMGLLIARMPWNQVKSNGSCNTGSECQS